MHYWHEDIVWNWKKKRDVNKKESIGNDHERQVNISAYTVEKQTEHGYMVGFNILKSLHLWYT